MKVQPKGSWAFTSTDVAKWSLSQAIVYLWVHCSTKLSNSRREGREPRSSRRARWGSLFPNIKKYLENRRSESTYQVNEGPKEVRVSVARKSIARDSPEKIAVNLNLSMQEWRRTSTCEPIRPAPISRSGPRQHKPRLVIPTHCIVPRRNLPTAAGRS